MEIQRALISTRPTPATNSKAAKTAAAAAAAASAAAAAAASMASVAPPATPEAVQVKKEVVAEIGKCPNQQPKKLPVVRLHKCCQRHRAIRSTSEADRP